MKVRAVVVLAVACAVLAACGEDVTLQADQEQLIADELAEELASARTDLEELRNGLAEEQESVLALKDAIDSGGSAVAVDRAEAVLEAEKALSDVRVTTTTQPATTTTAAPATTAPPPPPTTSAAPAGPPDSHVRTRGSCRHFRNVWLDLIELRLTNAEFLKKTEEVERDANAGTEVDVQRAAADLRLAAAMVDDIAILAAATELDAACTRYGH